MKAPPLEYYILADDLARDSWECFLRQHGLETFHELLTELEGGERIALDLKAETFAGRKLPHSVAVMLFMRVAIKTLAALEARERIARREYEAEQELKVPA